MNKLPPFYESHPKSEDDYLRPYDPGNTVLLSDMADELSNNGEMVDWSSQKVEFAGAGGLFGGIWAQPLVRFFTDVDSYSGISWEYYCLSISHLPYQIFVNDTQILLPLREFTDYRSAGVIYSVSYFGLGSQIKAFLQSEGEKLALKIFEEQNLSPISINPTRVYMPRDQNLAQNSQHQGTCILREGNTNYFFDQALIEFSVKFD